jgi:cytochrome c peroxidase
MPLGVSRAMRGALIAGLAASLPLWADMPAWTPAETGHIASMRLSQLPRGTDPSNAYEARSRAAALGRLLFHDSRLSANGRVSCATCHDPARQFQDGKPRGEAIAITARRTMPLAFAGHGPWLFWDGRKDSLWSQALAPLEDAREHGTNRLRVARIVKANYVAGYRAVFGAFPDLPAEPQDAGPLGSASEIAAWDSLASATRADVSRVFANVGKAIAAFERTLRHEPSRFDRYAEALSRGGPRANAMLDEGEANGLRVFLGKGQCVTCHNGPLLTDHFFHSTRVPPLDPANPDMGRAAGAKAVLADEFNCLGEFSDAKPETCGELRFINAIDPVLRRAFKTPSLRGVAERAPYMHAGQLATLEDVVDHYARAPEADLVPTARGHGHGAGSELQPIAFTDEERRDLVRFLRTLSSPVAGTAAGVGPKMHNK